MKSVDKSKAVASQSVFLISEFLKAIIGQSYEAKKLAPAKFL